MTPEQFLSELDKQTDASLTRFLASVQKMGQSMYEEVLLLLGKLQTRTGGKLRATAENLAIVETIGNKLKNLVSQSAYGKAVYELIQDFSPIAQTVDNYIGSLVEDFRRNEDLYAAVRKANIQTTVETLLGGGMEANFINPVKVMLRQHVAGSSDLSVLKQILRQQIVTESRLERYVNVTATDAVEQYSRNYIQVISQDLKLEYYLYAGTAISDSRDFCQKRAGKYFTRAEVESWAALEWSGKNPATTKATIYTYLGGYKCKHRLIPVSKAVYDANKKSP